MYTNLSFTDKKILQVTKIKWPSPYTAPCHSLISASIVIPQAFVPLWHKFKNAIRLRGDETWFNHFTRHSKQPGMPFWRWSDTWETSPIPLLMRKWKRLFVNGCVQQPYFNRDEILKPVPRWDQYISVFGTMKETWRQFTERNELHATLRWPLM